MEINIFAANFRAGELCMNFQLKLGNSENEKNSKASSIRLEFVFLQKVAYYCMISRAGHNSKLMYTKYSKVKYHDLSGL